MTSEVAAVYDGEGHRTQLRTYAAGQASPVATWDFRYQGDALVEERLTDATHAGTVVWSYLVDDTGAIVTATRSFGGSQAAYDGTYLVTWSGHGDALGLWKIEATGALTLANAYTYSTWGAPTTSTHNSYPDLGFRFTYVGQHDVQWDNSYGLGLLYMHARHYAPSLGRFLQPDPVAAEENAWAYAANSPVTIVDPSGTAAWPSALLNWAERAICNQDRRRCALYVFISGIAWTIARYNFPGSLDEGVGDAFRHCVWQCLLRYHMGHAQAVTWGNAHERGDSSNYKRPIRAAMDQHNNRVGRLFGAQMHLVAWVPTWSVGWASYFCKEAVKRGFLFVIRGNRLVPTR